MNIWTYDGTFEGFLTLVFDCYDLKIFPEVIIGKNPEQMQIFNSDYEVVSDRAKAKRVWKGLHKKISGVSCEMLFRVFLSEQTDIEQVLLNYIKRAFASPSNTESDFRDEFVLKIYKVNKMVGREAERILMFVRFQKTVDDIYYASFDPKYNVLPLTISHFENRFTDQKWVIYDTRRNYGFYYDMKETQEITFSESAVNPVSGKIDEHIMAEDEKLFQTLWKTYFDATCIRERLNPRLHMQFLPKRFWKYLPEKQTG
ncbi:TIGR03915 family putative DNA repair protein [Saccharicrinis sp. FJH2]|uniref:TIGR03915 family putative DNA repair protein n=1 Tax=Saccharicrinis sp. FJH65 TaxID=3344659 RepID=UPI0035F3D4F7